MTTPIKKKTLLAALPLLLLTAQMCTSTANAAEPDATGLVLVSIAEDATGKRQRTGFVVDEQGHIIARIRAPSKTLTLYVKDINGVTYTAQTIAYDEVSRLSLLRVIADAPSLKPYLFARDPAEIERKVFGIAVPHSHILTAARTAIGTLSTVQQPDATSPSGYYLHNAVVGKAGLGGPLFNNCGEVVGVITPPPLKLMRPSMFIARLSMFMNKSTAYATPVEWLLSQFSARDLRPQLAAEVCLSEPAQAQSKLDEVTAQMEEAQTKLEQEKQRNAEADAQAAAAPAKSDEDNRQPEEDAQGANETESEQSQTLTETTPTAVSEHGTPYLIWGLVGGGALLLLALLAWILKRRSVTSKHRGKTAAQPHTAKARTGLAAHSEENTRIHATPSVFLEGRDNAGHSFALRIPGASIATKGGAVVGRSPADSDFIINHPEVSRRQFRLFSDGRLLMITDLGSTNGTHVDGKRLGAGEETVLADRSRVEISRLQLSVRFQ